MGAFEIRDYQLDIATRAHAILKKSKVVYLALQPRVGKTIASMKTAELYGSKNVLFITKLKAIGSVESDYRMMKPNFKLTVINYESIHKLSWLFDLVILDEAHGLGAFPKPSLRTKELKEKCWDLPLIYLSATPTAESLSQIYHQFWISKNSPFHAYTTFYKWAKDFVDVKKKFINGFALNDYKKTNESYVRTIIDQFMITFTQEQAGFTSFIEEEVIYVPIDKRIYKLMDILKRKKVYEMICGDTIVSDTPAKLQSHFHQLSGGTIKVSEEKSHIIDESKAWFIKSRFAGQKIAIFYQFIAERELLERVFPNNTSIPEEFNKSADLVFLSQMASGSQGTNLSTADCLIAYNISFSAMIYWQFRERMQTKDRKKSSKLFWIFSERGLEKHVYKAVSKKKTFTTSYFEKIIDKIKLD
jgi:hypothetical protein